MRLPSYTRIIIENFDKEVQKWIGKLVDPLNNFMLTMKNGLNKGITVNDNLSGLIKTFTVSNNSVSFSYSSSRRPQVVLIGSVVCLDSGWVPSPWSHTWSYADGAITCTFYGLDNTKDYSITLVVLDD
jgi:hypothetical protein